MAIATPDVRLPSPSQNTTPWPVLISHPAESRVAELTSVASYILFFTKTTGDRSPISVLTVLDVEQLRLCDQQRYH